LTGTRDDFLAVARSAATLLREPAVAERWSAPSALPGFGVGGLAGHLAYQILAVPQILAEPVPSEPSVSLLEHSARVEWIDAGPDDGINVRIRRGGEEVAADGPASLASRVDAAIGELNGVRCVSRCGDRGR
jgi:Mycothiol maleylpyruvate isomerase N-terminal domain